VTTVEQTMTALAALGSERTKQIYLRNGAHEPLFGVTTGAMKPLFRQIKLNQALAEQLYATGNYDAMYFAGMIAEPKAMTEADFDRWIEAAYCPMLSDWVVAVTLAEANCAQAVSDRWIGSGLELPMSAGWSCYQWLLGWRPDEAFDRDKLAKLLDQVAQSIHDQPESVRKAMHGFVVAVGVSYLPLHEAALQTARSIGEVTITGPKGACAMKSAAEAITKAKDKGRLGFKRRAVRC